MDDWGGLGGRLGLGRGQVLKFWVKEEVKQTGLSGKQVEEAQGSLFERVLATLPKLG